MGTARVLDPTQALQELWLPYWAEKDPVELRFSASKHWARHAQLPAEGYYSQGEIEASLEIQGMLFASDARVVSSPSGHQVPADERERSKLRRKSLIVLGTPDSHPLIATFQTEEKLRYRVRVDNPAGQIDPHVEVLERRGSEEKRYTDAPLDSSASEHVRYCVLTRYVQPLASRPVTMIAANSSAAVRAVAEKISDGRACVDTVAFLLSRLRISSQAALPAEFQVVFATVFDEPARRPRSGAVAARIEQLLVYLWANRESPRKLQPSVIAQDHRTTLDPSLGLARSVPGLASTTTRPYAHCHSPLERSCVRDRHSAPDPPGRPRIGGAKDQDRGLVPPFCSSWVPRGAGGPSPDLQEPGHADQGTIPGTFWTALPAHSSYWGETDPPGRRLVGAGIPVGPLSRVLRYSCCRSCRPGLHVASARGLAVERGSSRRTGFWTSRFEPGGRLKELLDSGLNPLSPVSSFHGHLSPGLDDLGPVSRLGGAYFNSGFASRLGVLAPTYCVRNSGGGLPG